MAEMDNDGQIFKPIKNVEFQHFTKLFFWGVIFILDICVSCTSFLKLLKYFSLSVE
jgi:hypothetical protein